MAEKDVLEDKIFTKTAFAVRIDQLEAGIKWERQLREQKDQQIIEMGKQFHGLSIALARLSSASDEDALKFWEMFMRYMPEHVSKALDSISKDGKPIQVVVSGLVQALKVYGMSKIGEINGTQGKA